MNMAPHHAVASSSRPGSAGRYRAGRYLIVTADDFGLHESVNDAIEQASHAGVLTAASLMISGPAAADAIRRAQRLPKLRVGLHLVLADGWPVLAPAEIAALVDRDGFMDDGMLRRSIAIFTNPAARRQIEAEIRAQLLAYRRTGLMLDHVNAHKHLHFHPTILSILLSLAREFGIRAIRVPQEPLWFARAHGKWSSLPGAASLAALAMTMKYRIRAAGILCNDQVFGIANSGAMDERGVLEVLARLPRGITEIYLHPAIDSGSLVAASMAGYRHGDELAALLSPRVRAAIESLGIKRGGYGDVSPDPTPPAPVYCDP
jgi:hopanoid biosynthesis associated protein HpnK